MSASHRARSSESAQRVNTAVELLSAGFTVPEASRQLSLQHQISERQARRYVERARDVGTVEVPGPKSVFTVKLTSTLVGRVKDYARASQRTLSSLVAQALEEFLGRMRAGPGGGGSAR